MRVSFLQALRVRGMDVETAREAGMVGRDDGAQLGHVATAGRVLCTFNARDFLRLHAEWLARGEAHAGLIVMAQRRFEIGEAVRRLFGISTRHTPESMRGQVIYLSTWWSDRE